MKGSALIAANMAEETNYALKRRKHQVTYRASKRRRTSLGLQDYLTVLNHDIREASHLALEQDSNVSSHVQQHGLSVWTDGERRDFVQDTARRRFDNVQNVASAMPNKSVFEILAMKREMEDVPPDRECQSGHYSRFSHINVAAAAEISEECSMLLDESADHLGRALWQQDRQLEEQRHGDHWLLTQDIADDFEATEEEFPITHEDAEDQTDAMNDAPNSMSNLETVRDPAPAKKYTSLEVAMQLLDLKIMLYLSDYYYMTPQSGIGQKDSARVDGEDMGQPSLFATAFTDIYNVVVMLTKRLVAASAFQASSRLRAVDCDQDPPKAEVKAQDVASAVDVLGLLHNSSDYWLNAPRRLKLKVLVKSKEKEARRGWEAPDYGKIESALMGDRTSRRYRQRSSTRSSARSSSGHSSADENAVAGKPDAMAEEVIMDNSKEGEPHSLDEQEDMESDTARESGSDAEEDQMASMDRYLEALDGKMSAEEELRLWNMLRAKPPPDTIEATEAELPPVPRIDPRTSEDLVDWRDRCDFQSPWERYGPSLTTDVLPTLRAHDLAASARFESQAPTIGGRKQESHKVDGSTGHQVGELKVQGRTAQVGRSKQSTTNSTAREDEESDESDSSVSPPVSDGSPRRGRSRHRSSSISYRYEGEHGMSRPEDLPSDSEDDYQPEKT